MIPTYVINLDKDVERMQFMHSQLNKLSIEYERFKAILLSEYTLSESEYNEDKAIKCGGRALLPGELGCALSHAKILQMVVDKNQPFALILEDDVVLPQDFLKKVEIEVARNQEGQLWDYLLFDYMPVGKYFIRMWINSSIKNYKKIKEDRFYKKLIFISTSLFKFIYIIPLSIIESLREKVNKKSPKPVRFFRPVYFAGAYIVTKTGAEKLLSLTKPIVYTADQLHNVARRKKKLKFRAYCPLIVSQNRNVFGSSILGLSGKQVKNLYGKI